MGRKILGFLFVLVALAGLFLFGYMYGKSAGTTAAAVELSNARSALDGARAGNADLERRLREVTELAKTSTDTVNSAIIEAGRITDSAKRIKYLIGAIRATLASLYGIVEKGTGTEKL